MKSISFWKQPFKRSLLNMCIHLFFIALIYLKGVICDGLQKKKIFYLSEKSYKISEFVQTIIKDVGFPLIYFIFTPNIQLFVLVNVFCCETSIDRTLSEHISLCKSQKSIWLSLQGLEIDWVNGGCSMGGKTLTLPLFLSVALQ